MLRWQEKTSNVLKLSALDANSQERLYIVGNGNENIDTWLYDCMVSMGQIELKFDEYGPKGLTNIGNCGKWSRVVE